MTEGTATLHELQTVYSLEDVGALNDALDALSEARRRAEKGVGSGHGHR